MPRPFTEWPMPNPTRKPPEKADPGKARAKCPGRSQKQPCEEGPANTLGLPTPASLGITVDQAALLETNTGRPARCFKCSEPKEEASP